MKRRLLASSLMLGLSVAHASLLDLGQVNLAYDPQNIFSEGRHGYDQAFLASVGTYYTPADTVTGPTVLTPSVSTNNSPRLSPGQFWSFVSFEHPYMLLDAGVPSSGQASINLRNLSLLADSGWAIQSLTWTLTGTMDNNTYANIQTAGTGVSLAGVAGGYLINDSASFTPVPQPAAFGHTTTAFSTTTTVMLNQPMQQVNVTELSASYAASGVGGTLCYHPVDYSQISCDSSVMESPLYSYYYGGASVDVHSATLSVQLVAAPVPEPSSSGMALGGLLAGAGVTRRMRRRG
jgi:hypothetical protein